MEKIKKIKLKLLIEINRKSKLKLLIEINRKIKENNDIKSKENNDRKLLRTIIGKLFA